MIELEINTAKLERVFKVAVGELQHDLRDGFDHIRKSYFKKFRVERLQGPPGIRGRRGGILTRFRSRLSVTEDNMALKIWTKSKAAVAHEYGATISAGGGKKLVIPLPSALTPSGQLKSEFKRNKEQTLEDVAPDLVPIQRNGETLLVRLRGKKILPLFILKQRIRVPARLGFARTWEAHKPRQIQILNSAVSKALKTAQEA